MTTIDKHELLRLATRGTPESLNHYPGRWRAELLAKARKELREAEGHWLALKNRTTGYYRAHVLVVELKRASLLAMEAVPLTEDEKP